MMRLLLILLSIFFIPLQASYLESGPGCCNLGFEGEFLYFKPNISNRVYAARQVPGFSETTFFVNNPNFKPAFRIGAFCQWCDSEIEGRFLYFNGGHFSSVAGDGEIIIMTDSPDTLSFAQSNVHFKYLAGDLAYIHSIYRSCLFRFSVLGGLESHRLRYIEDDMGFMDVGGVEVLSVDIRRQAWCWGIGPQMGLKGELFLCRGFSLRGSLRGSLLVSNLKWDSHFFGSGLDTMKTNQSEWVVLPKLDIRLGLMHEKSFAFFRVNIEAGYEFLACPDSIGMMIFANPLFQDIGSDMKDFSLHGPYAALRVLF